MYSVHSGCVLWHINLVSKFGTRFCHMQCVCFFFFSIFLLFLSITLYRLFMNTRNVPRSFPLSGRRHALHILRCILNWSALVFPPLPLPLTPLQLCVSWTSGLWHRLYCYTWHFKTLGVNNWNVYLGTNYVVNEFKTVFNV